MHVLARTTLLPWPMDMRQTRTSSDSPWNSLNLPLSILFHLVEVYQKRIAHVNQRYMINTQVGLDLFSKGFEQTCRPSPKSCSWRAGGWHWRCRCEWRRARPGRAATVVEFAFVDFVPVGGRVSETHCIKTYVKIRVLWKNLGRLWCIFLGIRANMPPKSQVMPLLWRREAPSVPMRMEESQTRRYAGLLCGTLMCINLFVYIYTYYFWTLSRNLVKMYINQASQACMCSQGRRSCHDRWTCARPGRAAIVHEIPWICLCRFCSIWWKCIRNALQM